MDGPLFIFWQQVGSKIKGPAAGPGDDAAIAISIVQRNIIGFQPMVHQRTAEGFIGPGKQIMLPGRCLPLQVKYLRPWRRSSGEHPAHSSE